MKLKNLTKVAKTFNIECLAEECADGKCLCTDITTNLVEELDDGTRGTRELTRRLAGSITILGKATSEDLPAWIANARSVKAAVAAGALRVVA